MVGLAGATSDKGIRTLFKGIGNAEYELSGFIAAAGSRKKVVTLDVKVDTAAERLAQGGHALDGGRPLKVISSGKLCEVHRLSFLCVLALELKNGLHFEIRPQRQRSHLEGAARGIGRFEVLGIDLVDGLKVADVGKKDGRFDRIV